jgi:hypothetical protein
MRLQKAFLRQRLCQVDVTRRRQQKPEYLWPMGLNDTGKFARSRLAVNAGSLSGHG